MKIDSIKQDHLVCRTYGHRWDPQSVTVERATNHVITGYLATLWCDRCQTERTQRLTRDGTIVGNRYAYPENYLQNRRKDVLLRRIDMRAEYIRRAMDGAA